MHPAGEFTGRSQPGDGPANGIDRRFSRPPGRVAPTPRVSLLAFGLLLAGATAGVFLAGGPPQGSLGIFLLCAGAALTCCPPQAKVEWRLWLAAAAVVGCGALAFLPERWFGVPAWRRTLEAAPAIHLPATITPVPWETGFWLALLALTLLTGLFLLAHPIRSHWLFVFALTAALAAGTYGALAIYARETGWHYRFASDATFGFFPNRNHTATLLFVGSLLALGVLSVALREGRWFAGLLAAAVMTVCVTALGFFSSSRGGVVFLLVGVVLWVAGLGRGHRDTRLVVSFTALLLAGGVLFLVSGSEVRNRLLGKANPVPVANPFSAASPMAFAPRVDVGDAMHNLTVDFRLRIYRDTFDAVRDFPLTGMGLGTFAAVFPQYRQASLFDAAVIHPESDWFMLTAEAGVPAALCGFALVVLAVRRLRGERDHPYWPLRWGCAVAAGAAALHGTVDVPLHRVVLGWWVLIVAGLALQSTRASVLGRFLAQQTLFVAGGIAALVLGGALVRAQWFGGPPLPAFTVQEVPQKIYLAYQQKDYSAATLLARHTIRDAPLFAPAYFYLGGLLALSDEEGTDNKVDAMFQAQRLLDPVSPAVPLQEAEIWAGYDPVRQTALWLDALSRSARITEANGGGFPQTLDAYRDLVRRAAGQPDAQRYLLSATRPDPRFAEAWSQVASPGLARGLAAGLAAEAAAHPPIVPDWYARRESEGPREPSREPGEWRTAAWPVRLRESVYAGRFEQAVNEVTVRYGISLALPAADPAAAAPDEGNPAAAFEQAWRAGDDVSARRFLEAVVIDPSQPAALELWRWRAAVAAHDGNWPLAWDALERYVRHTRQAEWP